jgi:hypothetical protein
MGFSLDDVLPLRSTIKLWNRVAFMTHRTDHEIQSKKRSEEKSPDGVLFEKTSAKRSSRLDPDDEGENSSGFQVNEVYSESYASDASASESSQLSSRKPSRPRSRRQKSAPESSSRPGLRKTSPDDYPLPSTPLQSLIRLTRFQLHRMLHVQHHVQYFHMDIHHLRLRRLHVNHRTQRMMTQY